MKIADYFKVSVDYLLDKGADAVQPVLAAHEIKLLLAYRNHPEVQLSIDRLLGIDAPNNTNNSGEDIAATLVALNEK